LNNYYVKKQGSFCIACEKCGKIIVDGYDSEVEAAEAVRGFAGRKCINPSCPTNKEESGKPAPQILLD